jgi:ubiquinone biosynthesis protein
MGEAQFQEDGSMIKTDILDGAEDIREPIRRILSEKYVHYKRAAEILAALSRFGFGRLWDSTAILKDINLDAKERKDMANKRTAVRLRLLLESLGPTFIKLGQMLSTRPDLIPEEYSEELGRLRDDVPPISFDQVKEVIEGDLKKGISDVFEYFEKEPIASASIGQVHMGVMKGTKEKLAVKVQRPYIDVIIKADIEILMDMAGVLKRAFKNIEHFDPEGVVKEFGHMIIREIDYTLEARNIERFRQNFSSEESVIIPKVYWDFSTKRILAMEFIEGISIDEKEKLRKMDVDYKELTAILGKAYIKQIFSDGFFHADPHQANLFVLTGNRICFLDFGAIGYLDAETKELVGTFYIMLIRQEVGRAAQALLELSRTSESKVDVKRLEWDLRDFIDYNLLRKANVPIDKGMNQRLVTIAMRHNIMLPSSFVLLERALMQIEGVCRDLNPNFDIVEAAQENLLPTLRERYKMQSDPLLAIETLHDYRKFASTFPKRVDKVLEKLENDDLTIKIDNKFVDDLISFRKKTNLILAVSIIAAVLIFYITYTGQTINLLFPQLTLTVVSILIIWFIAVILIYRRI